MYCKICGQDNQNDVDKCRFCGALLDSDCLVPGISDEIDLEETDHDALSDESDLSRKKILSIICLILAAVLLVLFCFRGFRSMLIRETSNPARLLKIVYTQKIEEAFSNSHLAEGLFPEDNMSVAYNTKIEIGDRLLSLLADSMAVSAEDILGLSDIMILCDASYNDGISKAKYDFALNDQHIISVEQYVDRNQKQQWLLLPEISNTAFVSNVAEKGSVSDNMLTLSPDLLNEVCNLYIKMLFDGFENINISKQTITVDEVTQRLFVLEAAISIDQLYQTILDIINDLKENEDVSKLLKDAESQTGLNYSDDFVKSLLDYSSQLQTIYEQMDTDNEFVLRTYLNQYNEIVGMQLSYIDDGFSYKVFSCITVTDNEEYAAQIVLFEYYQLQGTGTKGDSLNGNFSVSYSDRPLCQLEVYDFICNPSDICGSIIIKPEEKIVEHFLDQLGFYEFYLQADRLPELSLKLILNWNDNDKAIDLTAYTQMETLCCIEFAATPKSLQIISIPNNLSTDSDLSHWLSNMDTQMFTALIDRLTNAGINCTLFR